MAPLLEQYIPVTCDVSIPAFSDVTALYDDRDGLTIVLTSSDEHHATFRVCFRHRLAFRVTDEGDRLRSMPALHGKAVTPICRVQNSEWLAWFLAEANGVRDADILTHWAILTPDDIVDVIAAEAPTIERFDPTAA